MPQPGRAPAGGRRVADGLDQVRFNRAHFRTDGRLNSLVGAVEMLQENVLIECEDGIESHQKRPDHSACVRSTCEFEVTAIQEPLIHVVKHAPDAALQPDQLRLRPLLCEPWCMTRLQLGKSVFEPSRGLILP